jgi:hypothetical protein
MIEKTFGIAHFVWSQGYLEEKANLQADFRLDILVLSAIFSIFWNLSLVAPGQEKNCVRGILKMWCLTRSCIAVSA